MLSTKDNKDTADLWLLNSCTVKSPAEDHFRNAIREAQKKQKYIVVSITCRIITESCSVIVCEKNHDVFT